MKRKLVIALIVVAVAALLFGGGVLAYNVLWSGKARITIETPPIGIINGEETEALQITEVRDPGLGTFKDGVWTASLIRGSSTSLYITVQNNGADYATVESFVNDKSGDVEIAPGIIVTPSGVHTIAPTFSYSVGFGIIVGEEAQPGTFPDVLLEIRIKD